jgi:O-succinylbenzoic acid--CoA ligase
MKSLSCPLDVQIALRPNHAFVITPAQTISYTEFGNKVAQAENYLDFFKIKPTSRLALWEDPSIDSIALLYAIWKKRAIACILNTRLPLSAVIQQLKSLHCTYLFLENKSLSQWPSSKTIHIQNVFKSHSLIQRLSSIPSFKENQPTTILFTSGSTAAPKAALLTLGNFYFNALGSNQNLNFRPNDRWLLSLPLYHVSGLGILFRALLSGGSIVLNSKTPITDSLKDSSITHLSVVPTQLYQLLQNSKNIKPLQKLKAILIGGSAIPTSLIQQSLKHKLPIYITYGLTEMASQVATSSKIKGLKDCSKVEILPYRQIKITPNKEILVKGKTLFKSYVDTPKNTKTFTPDGWFQTGDLGEMVQKKYLQVLGRKDNMFISGGENIQPEEIEKYLLGISSIKQALVIGIPDLQFGVKAVAILEQSLPQRLTQRKLTQLLSKHLPKYKIPNQFYNWPTLQKSTLKINRQQLTDYFHKNKKPLKPIL